MGLRETPEGRKKGGEAALSKEVLLVSSLPAGKGAALLSRTGSDIMMMPQKENCREKPFCFRGGRGRKGGAPCGRVGRCAIRS